MLIIVRMAAVLIPNRAFVVSRSIPWIEGGSSPRMAGGIERVNRKSDKWRQSPGNLSGEWGQTKDAGTDRSSGKPQDDGLTTGRDDGGLCQDNDEGDEERNGWGDGEEERGEEEGRGRGSGRRGPDGREGSR